MVKPGGTEIGNGVEPHFYRDGLPFPDLDPVLPGSRPRAAATVRAPGAAAPRPGAGATLNCHSHCRQKHRGGAAGCASSRFSGTRRWIVTKVDREWSAAFSGAHCDRSDHRRPPGTPDWPPAAGTAPHRGPLRIGDPDGMDLHQVFVRLEPVYREGTEGVGERAHPEPGRFPVRGPGRQYRRAAGRGFVILGGSRRRRSRRLGPSGARPQEGDPDLVVGSDQVQTSAAVSNREPPGRVHPVGQDRIEAQLHLGSLLAEPDVRIRRRVVEAETVPELMDQDLAACGETHVSAETGQFSRWGRGARLTRRVRKEYRVYFDRNATMSGAQRRG